MVSQIIEERILEIPKDVEVSLEGRQISVKGPKGEVTRDFSYARRLFIQKKDEEIRVHANFPQKTTKALVGTISSHIANMIHGVTRGFTYKLKIVSSHFPIFVDVKRDTVTIQNYLGEKAARFAKIVGNTQVRVEEDNIIVEGPDIEKVAQTAANIQEIPRLRGKRRKDTRVFLDGIYIYDREKR
ncbi:MAG: 50S ribosomal protein L6 [Candidatus Heimdallarchaeota archaeon]